MVESCYPYEEDGMPGAHRMNDKDHKNKDTTYMEEYPNSGDDRDQVVPATPSPERSQSEPNSGSVNDDFEAVDPDGLLETHRELVTAVDDFTVRQLGALRLVGKELGMDEGIVPNFILEGTEEEEFLREMRREFDLQADTIDHEALLRLQDAVNEYDDASKGRMQAQEALDSHIMKMKKTGLFLSRKEEFGGMTRKESLDGMMAKIEVAFNRSVSLRNQGKEKKSLDAESEARDAMRELKIRLSLKRGFREAKEEDLVGSEVIERLWEEAGNTKSEGENADRVESQRMELEKYLSQEGMKYYDMLSRAISALDEDNMKTFGYLSAEIRRFQDDTEQKARRWYPLLFPRKEGFAVPPKIRLTADDESKIRILPEKGTALKPVSKQESVKKMPATIHQLGKLKDKFNSMRPGKNKNKK